MSPLLIAIAMVTSPPPAVDDLTRPMPAPPLVEPHPADLVLAGYLLAAPAGTPDPDPEPDHWPSLRAALVAVARDRELVDPREEDYLLAHLSYLTGDLDIVRRRAVALADAPPLADADRLPDRTQCGAFVRFNRAFRRSLEARQKIEFDRAEEFTEVIKETDKLYEAWDAVRDARCDYMGTPTRRLALKKLRGLIGPEAYARGELPPNVPTWRLDER